MKIEMITNAQVLLSEIPIRCIVFPEFDPICGKSNLIKGSVFDVYHRMWFIRHFPIKRSAKLNETVRFHALSLDLFKTDCQSIN